MMPRILELKSEGPHLWCRIDHGYYHDAPEGVTLLTKRELEAQRSAAREDVLRLMTRLLEDPELLEKTIAEVLYA